MFEKRIRDISLCKKSRIIVGLDIKLNNPYKLTSKVENILDQIQDEVCAIKVNFHLLLPLRSKNDLSKIIDQAHDYGLQAIADVKLNDVSSTNLIATGILWDAGFDAVIANPFVGFSEGLGPVLEDAHQKDKGVIFLIYMSHKGAVDGYGLKVLYEGKIRKMYDIFVERAVNWGANGLIVGATNPKMVAHIKAGAKGIPIFSPGVIVQGGDPKEAVRAGADYLIVARAIVEAEKPKEKAREIREITW